jgi:hypothetical protein
MNIVFQFFNSGLTLVNFALQTTSEGKTYRLRTGEHAGQIPLLITLALKTMDKAYIDICAMWAVLSLAETCHRVFLLC